MRTAHAAAAVEVGIRAHSCHGGGRGGGGGGGGAGGGGGGGVGGCGGGGGVGGGGGRGEGGGGVGGEVGGGDSYYYGANVRNDTHAAYSHSIQYTHIAYTCMAYVHNCTRSHTRIAYTCIAFTRIALQSTCTAYIHAGHIHT